MLETPNINVNMQNIYGNTTCIGLVVTANDHNIIFENVTECIKILLKFPHRYKNKKENNALMESRQRRKPVIYKLIKSYIKR